MCGFYTHLHFANRLIVTHLEAGKVVLHKNSEHRTIQSKIARVTLSAWVRWTLPKRHKPYKHPTYLPHACGWCMCVKLWMRCAWASIWRRKHFAEICMSRASCPKIVWRSDGNNDATVNKWRGVVFLVGDRVFFLSTVHKHPFNTHILQFLSSSRIC